jgi:hypothetical protein
MQQTRQMTQSEMYRHMMMVRKVSEEACRETLEKGWDWAMAGLVDLELVDTKVTHGKRFFILA